MNLSLEQQIFGKGYDFLGALDEAGRGPLAGPVVAACVVLTPEFAVSDQLRGVKDSKKLSEKKREALLDSITESFYAVGVGICDHETIDRINILEATFLAMKKAIGALKQKADFYLLDGKYPIRNSSIAQEAIVKGDDKVFSIAAASIVAKVTRDRIMREMHERFPAYGFDQHKGYGTKSHLEALRAYGPCAIHRKSFKQVNNNSFNGS
jgi:ribonuclease HII